MNSTRTILSALLLAGCLSGCYELRDNFQEQSFARRNRLQATFAWWEMRDYYGDVGHRGDFGKGFRAGYADVAQGNDGTPPSLPPREYWGPRYRNARGQSQTVAWFDGYEHGTLAAYQDGAAGWNELVTRNTIRNQRPPEDWLEPEADRTAEAEWDQDDPLEQQAPARTIEPYLAPAATGEF